MTPRTSSATSVVLSLVLGLLVGSLTSLLQAVAEFPWLALVNAVSPWVTTAFVAGALQRSWRSAMVVGLAATLLQVVGYYVTAELRGYDAGLTYVVVWSLCAVVAGPVFGAAGHSWRRAAPAGLGAAALVAVWATEAVIGYQWRLGYTSSAVLFGVVALLLAVALPRHRNQYASFARWILPALVAGALGNLVLDALLG